MEPSSAQNGGLDFVPGSTSSRGPSRLSGSNPDADSSRQRRKRVNFEVHEESEPGHELQDVSSRDDEGQKQSSDTAPKRKLLAAPDVVRRWAAILGWGRTFADWKPALRTALAAWLGLLILLIRPSEEAVGNSIYFMLLVAFLLPASQTIAQTLETWVYVALFASISWAWLTLAILIAHAVRLPADPARVAAAQAKFAYLLNNPAQYHARIMYDGTFIQARPAVVLAIFLSVGAGVLLLIKVRTQPGPMTFPVVLGAIFLDVTLTIANFAETADYSVGVAYFKPLAIQGGINILCSIAFFPQSMTSKFKSDLPDVLDPLIAALHATERLFAKTQTGFMEDATVRGEERVQEWASSCRSIRDELRKSLAPIGPLQTLQRYLLVDISVGRLSGDDMRALFQLVNALRSRSNGLSFYFDMVVNNVRRSHIDSTAYSVHSAVFNDPGSRESSIRNAPIVTADDVEDTGLDSDNVDSADEGDRSSAEANRVSRSYLFKKRQGNRSRLADDHRGSKLSLKDYWKTQQLQPVGAYESRRYIDIEKLFADHCKGAPEHFQLISQASVQLVASIRAALQAARNWLVSSELANAPSHKDDTASSVEEALRHLESTLDAYRDRRRSIVRPFRHLFDPIYRNTMVEARMQSKHYRALFQNFVGQQNLIEFGSAAVALLRQMREVERTQPRKKLRLPRPSAWYEHWSARVYQSAHDPIGPDVENVFDRSADEDLLGQAISRQPEYEPFHNGVLAGLSRVSHLLDPLASRSLMYAVKASILTALVSLPNWFISSASFFYYNRGIWCIFMVQLTFAVFAGETTAGWIARCISSFWGCVTGLAVWYIGNGRGSGNAYGFGAACAVVFPPMAFFRVHYPGSSTIAFLTPVTFSVVLGYSWVEGSIGPFTYAAPGWSTAWRRFVAVVIGITAAWIFAYLPPAFSGKKAIRSTYARAIAASGDIFCDILSHANGDHGSGDEDKELQHKLLAWRTKLQKLSSQQSSAAYEYSIRGRWPREKYDALLQTCQELLSLLSQLHHTLCQMDRAWRQALFERTKLSDFLFLGDILAVVSICSTSLRSGFALPQITPAPLIERFRKGNLQGWNLPDGYESEGVPSIVTGDVLESDEYMLYANGIVLVFALLGRLDRIVVISKTLLGENYHIGGLHLNQKP